MDVVVILYMVIGIAAVSVGYSIIRAVDFCFTRVEDKRRHKMRKSEIRCYTRCQGQMTMEVTRKLNDNLYNMFNKMGDP